MTSATVPPRSIVAMVWRISWATAISTAGSHRSETSSTTCFRYHAANSGNRSSRGPRSISTTAGGRTPRTCSCNCVTSKRPWAEIWVTENCCRANGRNTIASRHAATTIAAINNSHRMAIFTLALIRSGVASDDWPRQSASGTETGWRASAIDHHRGLAGINDSAVFGRVAHAHDRFAPGERCR